MEKDIKTNMEKSLESLKNKFKQIRAGRANVDMLSSIQVEYYGSMTALNQVANLSTSDARTLIIDPWDKGTLSDIEKSIQKSNLNLNPINDGKIIRIILPELTEERRKEFLKIAKKELEEGKVSVRNVRKHFNTEYKKMEENGEISEDQLKAKEKEVQKITDEYVLKMDNLYHQKEKDIMGL